MRLALFAAALIVLTGCSKMATCRPGTIFLTVDLRGAAASASSLRVDVSYADAPMDVKSSIVADPGFAEGTLEIDPPRTYQQGQIVTLVVTARDTNGPLASATVGPTVLPAGCAALQATLGDDGGGNGGTGGNNDLSATDCVGGCSGATPLCTAGTCSACTAAADPEAGCAGAAPSLPHCLASGAGAGQCVQCRDTRDCGSIDEPICDAAAHGCRRCVSNGECPSSLCDTSTGRCAAAASLLYVGPKSCSDTNGGTTDLPFCHIQNGLNKAAATGKRLVVLAGTYAENVQAVPSMNGGNDFIANVVGVGAPIIKPSASGPALVVFGTAGNQVTVSFDGFVFDGSGLTDSSDGVDCNGGSGNSFGKTSLTLTHSSVRGASGLGLYAQEKCTLTIDSDEFVGNKEGGLRLDGSDFALTNLVVNGNGTAGNPGTTFGGIDVVGTAEAGKTTMFNLTIVNNLASAGGVASGIMCPTAAPTTAANIVVLGNQGPSSEVQPQCGLSFSAFVGATGSNNETIPASGCGLADLFVDPANADFHPKKGGARPCTLVDQGTSLGAPTHDFDGVARPQPAGGAVDIGAFEAH